MSALPDISIQEVCPRDGLQIEPIVVPTDLKIALIDRLSALGFRRIEAGSFVSPKAVPALADGDAVFHSIARREGVVFVALIPNLRGAERALEAGADEVNFVMSASETHNRVNMGMDHQGSLSALAEVTAAIGRRVHLNATLATAFGCPFEGEQHEDKVLRLIENYLRLGAQSITLADTTGMANPKLVRQRVKSILSLVPRDELTLHFHNTRGLGLVNVMAGFDAGAVRFDASLGGLGGCPFAPGASGNVCTEDLVNLCRDIGLNTGLDLEGLIALSRELPSMIGHPVPGQVAKAGRACDLHPVPLRLTLTD
ncbi:MULTISPECIES: hydroxymethylglutaryl-CoA lyase [unclassified Bradyrhizobium]|uniref:hydroxymethylglutaryl-CoA lyase n=1 Tax=unclassified Bradyrhizobium TaxID=2631580 RepID=UPI001FF9DFBB|nr:MULTISPECIES: hydroxymethylglutaryl-CoA lyase [unclassified Bradyrhizobium]MCK1709925.1 hydroxymethylglutaryl-CoA lyase [Bradyrhizobium sp. 143]MCK1729369.1 hydroxymethylglutaryl-CoA lyase [Bradyrhizobium sp. 142]